MVMMVLWGLVSPQLLQKVMALYKADLELLGAGKLDVSGIHKMAGLGSNGNLPNHCWRDLKRILPAVELPFVPCCPLCPVGLEANLMWWNFRPLQLPGLIIFTVFSPGWLEVSMLATWGPIYSHQSL